MTYNYLLGLWGKKGRGLAIDVSSGPVFLSKKRRIGMDVSSGLIFLTHTQKKNKIPRNKFHQGSERPVYQKLQDIIKKNLRRHKEMEIYFTLTG